jgi:hypothetical protein
MQKQGKILRNCTNGNGLISSQGEKWEFNLETHWKSDSVPYVGESVNFVLDDNNQLVSAEAIDPRAEVEKKLKDLGDKFKTDGLPVAQGLLQSLRAHISITRLVLFVLLLITWYNSTAVIITQNYTLRLDMARIGLSFFSMINLVSGFLGFLAWVSLLALLLPLVWRRRAAYLGALLPPAAYLFFYPLAIFFIQGRRNISIDPGIGFFISCFLCLVCIVVAIWDFWKNRA